jgi:hypothetical protein
MASHAASHSEDCVSTTPSRKLFCGFVEPGAIAAAVEAEAQAASRRDQVRDALARDLEAARYSADRAGTWFCLHRGLSLVEALKTIEADGLLHPP